MLLNDEPLRKILGLERKKGYLDTAVIGGLDKFLHRWADQAVESINNPRLLNRFRQLVNPGYSSLTRQQRQKWINSMLLPFYRFTFCQFPLFL